MIDYLLSWSGVLNPLETLPLCCIIIIITCILSSVFDVFVPKVHISRYYHFVNTATTCG